MAEYCVVDGCLNKPVGRGMCAKHYKQWRRKGKVSTKERYVVCRVKGCEEKPHGLGLCRYHYNKYKRAMAKKQKAADTINNQKQNTEDNNQTEADN